MKAAVDSGGGDKLNCSDGQRQSTCRVPCNCREENRAFKKQVACHRRDCSGCGTGGRLCSSASLWPHWFSLPGILFCQGPGTQAEGGGTQMVDLLGGLQLLPRDRVLL